MNAEAFWREEIMKLGIIEHCGKERFDLEAYNCIYDEKKGEYTGVLHKHKVLRAWDVSKTSELLYRKVGESMWDGIAFRGEGVRLVFGCSEKYFDKVTDSTLEVSEV